MTKSLVNVLFLCTGNSARSILAEAVLNTLGSGRFRAYSAGSKPVGKPNPYALELLRSLDIDTRFARSKSWEEFTEPAGIQIDLVITVCDSAAREVCPIFPGQALMVHWGLPDPAGLTDAHRSREAFAETHIELTRRVKDMLMLDEHGLSSVDLCTALNAIGARPNGV